MAADFSDLARMDETARADFSDLVNSSAGKMPALPKDVPLDVRISRILGADFDKESFAPTGLRINLSRGDNLQEKKLRLQRVFPQGELEVLPESLVLGLNEDVLVYRESPQSQFKMVEPEGFDLTDIAEAIAPSSESIAMEAAVAAMTGGGSIPAVVGRQMIGAFFGETGEQLGQSLAGTQAQTPLEIFTEPVVESAFSGAGGFAVSPLVATGNVLSGRGALQVGDEGLEVINAAKAIDPKLANKLTPGLVTDNPALMLNERQSAALLPGLQRRYRELTVMLDTAMKSNVNQAAAGQLRNRVTGGLRDLNESFLRRVGVNRTSASTGGDALQSGIEQYSKESKQFVDQLYDSARLIEEPSFDMTGIKDVAHDLRAGAKGNINSSVDKVIQQIEAIDGPIVKSDGSLVSVSDQLRNHRTEAYSLANVKPGERFSQANGQANDLFKSITETLDSPVNSNPVFVNAWKQASTAAGERLSTLEKAVIVKAVRSQNPAELMSYARPGQVGNLQTLRDTISPRRWDEFTSAFYTDLLSDPASVSKRLKEFDSETLDVLMPRAEQRLWGKIGREFERLSDLGFEQTVERQIKNKTIINEIVTSATPQRARTLMRAANETNNKPMRDSLRASIFDWAWDGVAFAEKNKLKINDSMLKSNIKLLKDSGLWGLLTGADKTLISNTEIVSRAFNRVIDAGTSIQAAEAAKGIGRLQQGAIRSFIQAGIISHFYLSSAGRKILIGSGEKSSRGETLRAIAGALTQVSANQDISQLEDEQ